VRHPIQALSLAKVIESEGSSGRKQLLNIISGLKVLIHDFGNQATYKKFLRGEILPQTPIHLDRKRKYVETFLEFRDNYSRLFSDVRNAIESDIIAEENFRWQKNVTHSAIDGRISGSFEEASHLVSTRVLFKLFDQVTKITLEIIKKNKIVLEKIPETLLRDVDVEGLVIKRPRLKIQQYKNDDFACTELQVQGNGELFLSGDIYHDYFAIWWQSSVTFSEFLDASRRFMASLPATKNRKRKTRKLFSGIYVYFEDFSPSLQIPMEYEPDMALDRLQGLIGEKKVQMIRIAHQLGDICYDFEPFRGIPQRIGFVSHLPCVPQLSWLIHSTNLKKTALMEWRNTLNRSFRSFITGETKNKKPSIQ
jgi:hypothetical protein